VETANLEDAKPYIDMGVRHFCVGGDIATISQWCKQQAKVNFKNLLSIQ
jgi:hypothetical protein